MHLSSGWIFLLAGIFGASKASRAKSLSEVDEFHENADQAAERPMMVRTRVLILLLNVAIALGGAVAITKMHNWNPLAPCPQCRLDGGAVS
jgi:hypothetical protein